MGWLRKLEDLMAKHGHKQPDLVRAMGIRQQSVSGMLNGKTKFPRADNALKIASFYRVRPEWLILDQGPQAPYGELSPAELQLIGLFRRISPAGQAYLLARSRELLDSEGPIPFPSKPDDSPRPPLKLPGTH